MKVCLAIVKTHVRKSSPILLYRLLHASVFGPQLQNIASCRNARLDSVCVYIEYLCRYHLSGYLGKWHREHANRSDTVSPTLWVNIFSSAPNGLSFSAYDVLDPS